MRIIVICSLIAILSACITKPNVDQHQGSTRFSQPGVSFVPPTDKKWSIAVRHTYQATLAMQDKSGNETIITQVSMFNIPQQNSNEEFLAFIKNERNKEPDTGRFEVINKSLVHYKERGETCVKHQSSSKDFGAKRDGKYTIYETLGMYCIHPNKPKIGVFVELSRKAPIGNKNDLFETLGNQLIQSVEFSEFRV